MTHSYFYPRPPRGGRLAACVPTLGALMISIHALREEGDSMWMSRKPLTPYFYPRPPRGGRPLMTLTVQRVDRFLSTPSARRATCRRPATGKTNNEFLSTPSARRATSTPMGMAPHLHRISIHALREEGDPELSIPKGARMDFYPRPPRGGRHFLWRPRCKGVSISIHALREEGDRERSPPAIRCPNFYPRPPRGGRLEAAGVR